MEGQEMAGGTRRANDCGKVILESKVLDDHQVKMELE